MDLVLSERQRILRALDDLVCIRPNGTVVSDGLTIDKHEYDRSLFDAVKRIVGGS